MSNIYITLTPEQKREFKELLLERLYHTDNYFPYDYNLMITSNDYNRKELLLFSQRKIISSVLEEVSNKFGLTVVGRELNDKNIRKQKYYLKKKGD